MEYMISFFDEYMDNIENYDAFIALISLLPNSYRYDLMLSVLLYDNLIEKGNLKEGVKPEGIIRILPEKKEIVLDYKDKSLTIFHLPPIHEI